MSGYYAGILDAAPLSLSDKKKYNEIFHTAKESNLSTEELEAYCRRIFTSRRYSYELKQRLALLVPSYDSSRLWGLRNFSGRALLFYVSESIRYVAERFTVGDIQALITNPAFKDSRGSEFDTIMFVLKNTHVYIKDGSTLQQSTINQIVIAPNMGLDFAAIILQATSLDCIPEGPRDLELTLDPVLDWVRKTYDLPQSMPEVWVRQFVKVIE